MDTVYTGFPNLCFQSNGTQNSKKKKEKRPLGFGVLQSWYQSVGFRSYMGAIGYGLPLER